MLQPQVNLFKLFIKENVIKFTDYQILDKIIDWLGQNIMKNIRKLTLKIIMYSKKLMENSLYLVIHRKFANFESIFF